MLDGYSTGLTCLRRQKRRSRPSQADNQFPAFDHVFVTTIVRISFIPFLPVCDAMFRFMVL